MLKNINYIGVFLTLRCGMGCDYCLNRQGDFAHRKEIDYWKWMEILAPIQTRPDLPITLQGGEPTMYGGFYPLLRELSMMGKTIDILTNGQFDVDSFLDQTFPEMFSRPAPYPSIRFSLHANTNGPKLFRNVRRLHKRGYSVGIWGIDHPAMRHKNVLMRKTCELEGMIFKTKEYLDAEHGTYKYPDAVTGHKGIMVKCTPSEMLFAPDGHLYPCHRFLYAGKQTGAWEHDGPVNCPDYGLCNPCDVKLKTNRFQEGGHCSVEIEVVK